MAPAVVAPEVVVVAATVKLAAEKMGEATPSTAAGMTAVAVMDEARLGLEVARDAPKGEASGEATGVVTESLGEATVVGGTAREAVQLGMALRPLSARLRPRARTSAR